MKITAITRYRHGALHNLLKRLGWSCRDLSERAGISYQRALAILSLRQRPRQHEADLIQRAFATEGLFFDVLEEWPEAFKGFGHRVAIEQTRDVPTEALLEASCSFSESQIDLDGLRKALKGECGSLPERERRVVYARFFDGKTAQEIGKEENISETAVHARVNRALLRLRKSPQRVSRLARFGIEPRYVMKAKSDFGDDALGAAG